MAIVKSLVLTGYGINCEMEMAYANKLAGSETTIAHINDCIDGHIDINHYHILNFPGGFSYGDDLGSGQVFANKLLYARTRRGLMMDHIRRFIDDGKLMIGICNGFQILVNMGLLPAFDNDDSARTAAIFYNDRGYRDCWVHLTINQKSQCIFTKGMDFLDAPIRHGEGKFIPADKEVMNRLWEKGHIVMQYADSNGRPTMDFPTNPNGSMEAIAGICNESGRVFGMMPHPEAFNHITNHPHYTRRREEFARSQKPLPEEGDGIRIWRNAVEYAKENLL